MGTQIGANTLTHLASRMTQSEDSCERAQLRQMLLELLTQIPDEQAEAIALRLLLGWSPEEVGWVTRVPPTIVRTRVRRGKKALLALLTALQSDSRPVKNLGQS